MTLYSYVEALTQMRVYACTRPRPLTRPHAHMRTYTCTHAHIHIRTNIDTHYHADARMHTSQYNMCLHTVTIQHARAHVRKLAHMHSIA